MKIFIACSTAFYDKIEDISKYLETEGWTIYYPNGYKDEEFDRKLNSLSKEESVDFYTELIRLSERRMHEIDAILVLNFDKEKNGIIYKNYIGGSTFLELYNAFRLDKDLYLYNDIPDGIIHDEIVAFKPTIINGDLSKIKKKTM